MARRPRPLRFLSILTFALLASVAVAAPPSLSELAFLPGDDALAGAWGDQNSPDVALGSNGSLAVWADARVYERQFDVYGIRLDASGNPVGASFVIADADGSQTRPLVAWNGQHWLVAYLSEGDLRATRVAPDGTVVDATPIAIASPGASAAYELASDGTGWAVLWAGRSAGNADLRGARIGANGAVLDPGGVQILPETYFVRPLDSLAFSRDRYLAVWGDDAGIVGLRLTPTLQKMDASPITIAGGTYFESAPSVAGNGTEFYLVWTESDNSYWVNQIKGSRVSLAGVASIPAGVAINENNAGGSGADVAWDGTRWIAAWTGAGAFANRISSGGSVLDGTGVQLASATAYYDAREAAVAATAGGGAKVVWKDYRNHLENDVWGASVSATGAASADVVIGRSAPSQQNPRVVWNGGGYAVAWLSATSAGARVLVMRLDASGAPIDPAPVEVASGPDLVEPGIAWSGQRYLVTWKARASVRVKARRLSPGLAFQDAAPIDVMTGDGPVVAALGDVFLVAVQNSPSYWQWRDTYAQRIDGATGTKLGGLIGIAGGFAWAGTLGTVGDRWLLSWEAHYSHNESPFTLTYAWVDADGNASSAYGLVSSSGFGAAGVEIASHGDTGAIVYSNANELYVLRVRADGTFPDGYTGVSVSGGAAGRQSEPAAAWNGGEFLVAFQDDRASTPFLPYPRSDLYASRVTAGGQVVDVPGGFPVATSAVSERQPSVAGSGGSALVVAAHVRGGVYGSHRIGIRRAGGAGSAGTPVAGVRFSGAATLSWSGTDAPVGYDVMRGDLVSMRAHGSIGDANCLHDDLPTTSFTDSQQPAAGDGFYYLVRTDAADAAPGTYDDPTPAGLAHNRDDDVGTLGGTVCP